MRTIYLDMDGVVADFNYYSSSFLGREVGWHEKDLTKEEWNSLAAIPNLYFQLPLIKESTRLVAAAKSFSTRFNIEFLTAIPRETTMPSAKDDKINWIDIYYPGFKVNFGPFSRDKWKWAKPGDILVDDKYSNITEWKELGNGIAIYHQGDFDTTVKNLFHAVSIEEPTILS
jgi:5'(3')-deoxyribonucleotidase